MSKFIADKSPDRNGFLLINCKILLTRDTEKRTLPLAGYKHATIVWFESNFFCKTEKENLLIY